MRTKSEGIWRKAVAGWILRVHTLAFNRAILLSGPE